MKPQPPYLPAARRAEANLAPPVPTQPEPPYRNGCSMTQEPTTRHGWLYRAARRAAEGAVAAILAAIAWWWNTH